MKASISCLGPLQTFTSMPKDKSDKKERRKSRGEVEGSGQTGSGQTHEASTTKIVEDVEMADGTEISPVSYLS